MADDVQVPSSLTNDDGDGEPALTPVVQAAQAGDEDAFVVLYRALHPGLLRYLWSHIGDAAEDVAAETWLHVARDIRRFEGDETGFRSWVITIGRHRMLDYLRQQGRRPPGGAPEEILALLPAVDNTEQAATDALATADALSMIARLPATQAEAILLTVVLELDAKTAGKILGKRAGAIRVAVHRGLRKLAEELNAPAQEVTAPAPQARRFPSPPRVTPVTRCDG